MDYTGKMVRVTDPGGHMFTGIVETLSSDYCLHEYGRDEPALQIGDNVFFENDIAKLTPLPRLAIIRATETWQRAGAYYVRIQAMAKKHHITLRQEIDEHDGSGSKYIVVTDDDFPIATARMYPLSISSVMLGRVVVLPEYRHQGIGTLVVNECQAWAEELGFEKIVVDSRENKVAFYDQLGFKICGEPVDGDTFRCVRMEKKL